MSGGGGHASGQGAGSGEHSAGQETGEVTVQEILLVVAEEKRTGFMHVLYTCTVHNVPGVVGVDEGALGLGVIVVLIVVLLGLPGGVHGDGVGAVLAAAGDVISSENPELSRNH